MFDDQEVQQIQTLYELPEKETLVGFFELLIVVDRRINPELYD